VTQSIQDLNNSVRLVTNKRTFVRFHVHSQSGGSQWTFAHLQVQRGGNIIWLNPINGFAPGIVSVRANPSRLFRDTAFWFELPSGFREGTVHITGWLNPATNWRSRQPVEMTYNNNAAFATVTFEAVPPVKLVTYRIGYKRGATNYWPPTTHVNQMHDWLRRAFPLKSLFTLQRSWWWGNGSVDNNGALTWPNCHAVNNTLFGKWVYDNQHNPWYAPSATRYYGMVSDGGGFTDRRDAGL